METMSFADVIAHLNKDKNRPISLLLGNGFSMAYDKDIFSYTALYEFLANQKDDLLIKYLVRLKLKSGYLMQRLRLCGSRRQSETESMTL